MAAACAILVEKLKNGTYRATCPVFPKLKARGKTEEEARRAMEAAIERHLARRNQAV
jgi:predicted RNase H-like HicB family nuclease